MTSHGLHYIKLLLLISKNHPISYGMQAFMWSSRDKPQPVLCSQWYLLSIPKQPGLNPLGRPSKLPPHKKCQALFTSTLPRHLKLNVCIISLEIQ